jgi:hypothetical protein
MNNDYIQYTKSIIKNKTINQNKLIIIIKDCNINNKTLQVLHKRMFEKHTNVIFIFIVPTLSYLAPEISKMCCCINAKFNKETVCKYIYDTYNYDHEYNYDIINMLLKAKYKVKKTKVDETFEKFFKQLKKSKNNLETINLCRELSHKVFHLNMPFPLLAKYIINNSSYSQDSIPKIVEIAAECDHLAVQSKLNILLYERFLVSISQIIL